MPWKRYFEFHFWDRSFGSLEIFVGIISGKNLALIPLSNTDELTFIESQEVVILLEIMRNISNLFSDKIIEFYSVFNCICYDSFSWSEHFNLVASTKEFLSPKDCSVKLQMNEISIFFFWSCMENYCIIESKLNFQNLFCDIYRIIRWEKNWGEKITFRFWSDFFFH